MADIDNKILPSTPDAVAAESQTVEAGQIQSESTFAVEGMDDCKGLYALGKNLTRPVPPAIERIPGEPLYRPLRIFAVDPTVSRLEGSIALVNVLYEPLAPGPVGRIFSVDNWDGGAKVHYRRADLDGRAASIKGGYDPSPSDPRFHQQMVYAICSNVYTTFKNALGRHITWGFERPDDAHRLIIRPHAHKGPNAYYDKKNGALCFGYFQSIQSQGEMRTAPGNFVFTCLSHDVVSHEVTHALLDGLRANFSIPSGPDVIAFHEAFSDLIALFQHFSYKEILKHALIHSGPNIEEATYLKDLAHQLGRTAGKSGPLRSAMDADKPRRYESGILGEPPHDRGAVLVAAVFEAFLTVYRRKTRPYIRLATGGTGVLPPGEMSADLQEILARKVSRLASQFLSILIRSIDYCPTADPSFGEYLRAIVTADRELVPDDVWGYREAFVDAFLKRNIFPRNVNNLSEDALLWRPPRKAGCCIPALGFARLRFQGDPALVAGPRELRRQAHALGSFVTRPEFLGEFGLVSCTSKAESNAKVNKPVVQSIRSCRRVGPDGQVLFDLVAEVTQTATVPPACDSPGFDVYGGSTVILGPEGDVRYVISKSVCNAERIARRRAFLKTKLAARYWRKVDNRYVLDGEPLRMLDERH